MTLISVGNIIVDLVVRVPSLPERGGDILAETDGMTPGGAFNTLVAATRQGLPSAYAGGHGTGPLGDLVRASLVAENIAVLSSPIRDRDTGFDIAMVDAAGERTFVTAFGAEAAVSSFPSPEPRDVVHVSGYGLLPQTNVDVIVPWLRSLDDTVTVLFDPGPLVGDIPAPALDAVRARADWLSCNEREAAVLAGLADAATASSALPSTTLASTGLASTGLAAGWRGVVIRLGEAGCLVNGERVHGFPVNAVDTNGAGDAHVGVFLAGLAVRLTPLASARRANAAAALSTTRRGPATSPAAAEVDALLAGSPRA